MGVDFQFDQTADGHILKLLHVVDEFTREALEIKCAHSIDADATVVVLNGSQPPGSGTPVRSLRQRA